MPFIQDGTSAKVCVNGKECEQRQETEEVARMRLDIVTLTEFCCPKCRANKENLLFANTFTEAQMRSLFVNAGKRYTERTIAIVHATHSNIHI